MIKETLNGAKAILSGFGENPPPQEVAQARANVCLHSGPGGSRCPHNSLSSWTITTSIAQVIQAQREKKHQLKLRVDGEEGLGVCKLCRCPMFLKVFYDWDTIYGHTTDETFEQFKNKWPACWMVTELNNHLKPQ